MNAIVTTTINPPTEAILRFANKNGWDLFVVGDLKTPHTLYERMAAAHPRMRYIHPDEQEGRHPQLSELIGWNCIQRRNFGFIEVFQLGSYDVVATVDDDNIPYSGWGTNILVNTRASVRMYDTDSVVFDPLSPTNRNELWHRGFPIELVRGKNKITDIGPEDVSVLVQADLWEGEADVDAIERIHMNTTGAITGPFPYASKKISPFNSQNTFISTKALQDYFLFPHIGRMDDIWASYFFQGKHPNSVVYHSPSVIQIRNEHRIFTDMKNEMIGYDHSLEAAKNPMSICNFVPGKSWEAFMEYRRILTQAP